MEYENEWKWWKQLVTKWRFQRGRGDCATAFRASNHKTSMSAADPKGFQARALFNLLMPLYDLYISLCCCYSFAFSFAHLCSGSAITLSQTFPYSSHDVIRHLAKSWHLAEIFQISEFESRKGSWRGSMELPVPLVKAFCFTTSRCIKTCPKPKGKHWMSKHTKLYNTYYDIQSLTIS